MKSLDLFNKEFSDPARLIKQKSLGKLTAEERILLLVDDHSFVELDRFAGSTIPGDGVLIGKAKINKRQVFLCSQDFSVMGGSLGRIHAKKICKVLKLAIKTGSPFISLNDSGGARIQEGISALEGYAEIFHLNTEASGLIPQISVILGPCAGGAVYSPALTDFTIMLEKKSFMFITGPQVIRSVTGENIDAKTLGGSEVHHTKSGVAHFVHRKEEDCLDTVRKILSFLPSNNLEFPSQLPTKDPKSNVLQVVPKSSKKTYDCKELIAAVFDEDSFLELFSGYAANAVCGFARLNGYSVGVVANQTSVLAGCLDIDSSDKIARFVRTCDCFNIPIINLVDVPGYLPGTDQEHNGIIRHGAKMLFAIAEATVPKIALVIRKAYGGGFIAMASKGLGFDIVLSWPSAEIAVLGAEQAESILNRKKKTDPKSFIADYNSKYLNPFVAAELGIIDMIIEPNTTREKLTEALSILKNKREKKLPRKHGNIPL